MKIHLHFIRFALVALFLPGLFLRADVIEMQNGDRYVGKVVSMNSDSIVLDSEILGKIAVPRKKMTSLIMGMNGVPLRTAMAAPALAESTNPAAVLATALSVNTNIDLSGGLKASGANTNIIGQIREQMLAGSPAAAGKYDEMVSGLLSGKMSVNDLRREAQSSADQLRELKRELGPEAGDSLDTYLEVLDNFLRETSADPASSGSKQ